MAIDDFGTGYSSLRLLGRLPVDTLKIDRSFILGVADTPHITTLVATIVSLARALDMHTVAEGVETNEQLKFLKTQIHPHFFFNTHNNVYSLALKKSDEAPAVTTVRPIVPTVVFMLAVLMARTVLRSAPGSAAP